MCTLHYYHSANVLNLLTSMHTGELERQLGKCHRVSGALLEADDLRHHRNSWLFDPAISSGDLLIDTGGHLLSILYGLGAQDIKITEARWDTVLAEKPQG